MRLAFASALALSCLAVPSARSAPQPPNPNDYVASRSFMTNYWPNLVNAARVDGHGATSWPPSGNGVNASGWCISASKYEWGEYGQSQILMRWDTSSLPDNAVILTASVGLSAPGTADGADPDMVYAAEWIPDWGTAGVEDYKPKMTNVLVRRSVAEVANESRTLGFGVNFEFADKSGISTTGLTAARFGVEWQRAPLGRNGFCSYVGPEFFLNLTYTVACTAVTGTIHDAELNPVSGVTISGVSSARCPNNTTLTDWAGRYSLYVDSLAANGLQLTASKAGFVTGTLTYPADQDYTLYHTASTWTDPGCEEDGSPLAGTATCTPPADQIDSVTTSGLTCTGATACRVTLEQLAAAGEVTDGLLALDARIEAQAAAADVSDPLARRAAASRPRAMVEFELTPDDGKCRGHVYNGRCGIFWHAYRSGSGGVTFTRWPAISGNNNPADQCKPNRGPIAQHFVAANGTQHDGEYRWGWLNGKFTGFEADPAKKFSPGKWRLDPWTVRCGEKTHRGAFELHGGSLDREMKPTQGCVRLSVASMNDVKSYWDHWTPNKTSANPDSGPSRPGVTFLVYMK